MANGDVALERPLVKTSTAVTRTILALTVLVATVFVAGWAWEAFQSGRLSAGVVAWLCMGVSVAELGWYNVAKKSELNNQHVWKERDAAFISMVMCGTGVLLFATIEETEPDAVLPLSSTMYFFRFAESWSNFFFMEAYENVKMKTPVMLSRLENQSQKNVAGKH